MSKRELKEQAQDELIAGLRASFSTLPDEAPQELRNAMSDQFARIERLFGYEPYSNGRGA